LFQVLRDDFLSLFVRGCWLVSFFFTPIYMFILIFAVMFGPKKGEVFTYSTAWDFKYITNHILVFFLLKRRNFTNKNLMISRYQFTTITSRLTSYFLFSFWLFFFFYGETLILIVFNFMTLVDTISSSSFFIIKQHTVFYLITTPLQLTNYIDTYIYFLTTCAFLFLMNLNFTLNYRYFKMSSIFTTWLSIFMLFYSFW
jgi:hypothetical protein